jgi:hypothetical protein
MDPARGGDPLGLEVIFPLDINDQQVLSSGLWGGELSMNPVDRLLRDEMNRLLDRIATTVPEGSLAAATAGHPSLRSGLDETEAQLAALRATLLETYAAWGKALVDLENLWALAAWKQEEASLAA